AKTEALAGCVDRHRSPERAAGHRFDRRRGDRIHLPGPRGDGLANSLERIENAMTGFSSSPLFVQHDTGPHHPERPDRIRAIHRAVREAGLIDSPDPFPEFEIDFGLLSPTPSPGTPGEGRGEGSVATATDPHAWKNPLPDYPERRQRRTLVELEPQPADEKWIRLVHPQNYIDR